MAARAQNNAPNSDPLNPAMSDNEELIIHEAKASIVRLKIRLISRVGFWRNTKKLSISTNNEIERSITVIIIGRFINFNYNKKQKIAIARDYLNLIIPYSSQDIIFFYFSGGKMIFYKIPYRVFIKLTATVNVYRNKIFKRKRMDLNA